MTIVMGLDQHRAQIIAEWLDTETGEVTRSRITPAHRQGVRRFCEKFRGQELEVALEATTGWRFVADELAQVGAVVHLAEPAETAARRGNKKRAKSDRADARNIRELSTIGRLPESWIPPDHLLDLRAQVRLRHTLSHQRGEWQQRIQAVLYHHGCPQRGELLTLNGRAWLAAQPLPGAAREQITVALAVIDALDIQLASSDGRSTAHVRAPSAGLQGVAGPVWRWGADRGHDPRRARGRAPILVLARRGPLRRIGHHRPPVRPTTRGRASQPARAAGVAVGAV